MPLLLSRMEKLLVVLLVASATVCLLTNLLVLIILASTSKTAAASQSRNRSNRKTYKLALRYQLMKNQSLVGILTVLSAVYPLKVQKNLLFLPVFHLRLPRFRPFILHS